MTGSSKDPLLVVLQMTGGNDYLNTVIPYTNPLYMDNRPTVGVAQDRVIPLAVGEGQKDESQPGENPAGSNNYHWGSAYT